MMKFLRLSSAPSSQAARRKRAAYAAPRQDTVESLEPRWMLTTAPLGVNVEGVADYGRSFMFADAMKSARHFGSVDAPWDEAASVDANGWPVGDAAATIIVVDNTGPTPIRIDGTYHLSLTGDVMVAPVASNAYVTNWNYDDTTDTTTADVVVYAGANALHLSFTGDPDGARNIHLWRPGTVEGQTFTQDFLQSMEGVQTLRMMDFARTNTTQVTEWADRPKPTDATQSGPNGAAWEYAIELANTLDKDLWVNVPAGASDDYVQNMAELFHTTLEPGRKVYVEYSNEVWNYSFQQFNTNYALAQADESANPADLDWDNANNTYQYAWRRVAKRLIEIKDVFANVYGADAINDTVRPVLASQIGWSFVLKDQLDYLEHRFGSDLSGQLYAIAGAPYVSMGDTLSNSATLTIDQVFLGLNQNLADMQVGIEKYETLATEHKLNNLYYEGGIDIQGDTGGNFNNAKLPANYDPRMYDLIRGYLINAFNNGVDGVMYYSQISSYTVWGMWGLTDSVQALDSAKMRGFESVAAEETPAITSGIQLPVGSGGVTSGAGSYLLDQWANNGKGGTIEGTYGGSAYSYLLNVTNPDDYTVQLSASTPYTDGMVEFIVDGTSVGTLSLPATGSLNRYANTATLSLTNALGAPLAQGHHTLKLRVLSGYLNIQSLTIGTPGYEAPPPLQPKIAVPLTPTGLAAATVDSTRIQLTWSDVSGETGYKIERSLDGTAWTQIAPVGADTVTYTDNGLSSGTKYWYRLRAVNDSGDSPYSSIVGAYTRLLAPTGVSASTQGASAIMVGWSPVAGAAAYMVQRSQGGTSWTTVTRVSRTTTSYTDYGLSANTVYSYRIVAVSLDGTLSDTSKVVSARTRKK